MSPSHEFLEEVHKRQSGQKEFPRGTRMYLNEKGIEYLKDEAKIFSVPEGFLEYLGKYKDPSIESDMVLYKLPGTQRTVVFPANEKFFSGYEEPPEEPKK